MGDTFFKLPGLDAAMQPHGNPSLVHFNIVYRLEIQSGTSNKGWWQDLHVHLQHQDRPQLRIHVHFKNVQTVKILNSGQLSLGIYDISSRGWENISFRATDVEDRGFELICWDVDFVSVTIDRSWPESDSVQNVPTSA